jgi:hypothetical protein
MTNVYLTAKHVPKPSPAGNSPADVGKTIVVTKIQGERLVAIKMLKDQFVLMVAVVLRALNVVMSETVINNAARRVYLKTANPADLCSLAAASLSVTPPSKSALTKRAIPRAAFPVAT